MGSVREGNRETLPDFRASFVPDENWNECSKMFYVESV